MLIVAVIVFLLGYFIDYVRSKLFEPVILKLLDTYIRRLSIKLHDYILVLK